jgi:hypothetical protein
MSTCVWQSYHTTLQVTPCQLVFGRDMIHNSAFGANWNQIQKNKTEQNIINTSNNRNNNFGKSYCDSDTNSLNHVTLHL